MLDAIFGSTALDERFSDVIPLGFGSSGLILSAHDKHLDVRVALKKLTFTDAKLSKQALREIRIIRRLQHENIIKVYEIIGSEGSTLNVPLTELTQLNYVYLVEEILDTDLSYLIRDRQLTDSHRKWFMFQLLQGLHYLHSANVIHRDLTPSNLLVDCNDLTLKIADFGLSRVLDPNYMHKGYLTERVGHCWYRSPEQIMNGSDYNQAVDVWSAGCVFAEMLLGKPLFPGANELDQVRQMLDAIYLEEDDWSAVLKIVPNKLLKNHPFRPRYPLGSRFLTIDPQALDLLEKMLAFSSAKRLTAAGALHHQFFSEFHELAADVAENPLGIEHEVDQLSPTTLRHKIMHESCAETMRCGALPRPMSNSPTPSEHTLDQILAIRDETQLVGSPKSASVEDLNKRNLKNSQENLSHGQHSSSSSSRESLHESQPIKESSGCRGDDHVQRYPSNEKEEAEITEEKAKQDEELSKNQQHKQSDEKDTDEIELKVDINEADVKEEGYQDENVSEDRYADDEQEYKLLEFEQQLEYSKFEQDTAQNEKNHHRKNGGRRRANRGGAQGLSEDLDERYRLPTEHLRHDRDYSNERIKQKKLTAQYRNIQALYRELQLSERLKEVSLESGAVGGAEEDGAIPDLLQHSPNDQETHLPPVRQNVHTLQPPEDVYSPLLIRTDLHPYYNVPMYHHNSRIMERHLQVNEDSASPDEQPVSPRNKNSGAKPKKNSKYHR